MKSRWITVVAALVAASLFALSVIGGEWWTIGDVASIGPFGSRRCFVADDCKPAGLNWIGGSDRWMRIGMAAWASGMLAMLTLAALAATVASKRTPRLLAKLVLSALATATLAGGAFVALYPGVESSTLGRGSILFALAIVLGAFAAIRLYRAPAAVEPEPAPVAAS